MNLRILGLMLISFLFLGCTSLFCTSDWQPVKAPISSIAKQVGMSNDQTCKLICSQNFGTNSSKVQEGAICNSWSGKTGQCVGEVHDLFCYCDANNCAGGGKANPSSGQTGGQQQKQTGGQSQLIQSECSKRGVKNCYGYDEFNISFVYPEGWQVYPHSRSSHPSVGFKLYAPGMNYTKNFTTQQHIDFLLNATQCEISFSPYAGLETQTSDLTAFIAWTYKLNVRANVNNSLISNNSRTICGEPGYEWIFIRRGKYGLDSTNGSVAYVSEEKMDDLVIFIKNGKEYEIECTTPINSYDKYKADFKSIIENCKIN